MALKLESELKKLTIDANKYANTQELNWISKNADLLEETIKGEPLLYPESVTEFPFALGGLVYALKELDDTARNMHSLIHPNYKLISQIYTKIGSYYWLKRR